MCVSVCVSVSVWVCVCVCVSVSLALCETFLFGLMQCGTMANDLHEFSELAMVTGKSVVVVVLLVLLDDLSVVVAELSKGSGESNLPAGNGTGIITLYGKQPGAHPCEDAFLEAFELCDKEHNQVEVGIQTKLAQTRQSAQRSRCSERAENKRECVCVSMAGRRKADKGEEPRSLQALALSLCAENCVFTPEALSVFNNALLPTVVRQCRRATATSGRVCPLRCEACRELW